MPNADTNGRIITQVIKEFISNHPMAHFVENFGTRDYLSMMSNSGVMVGNSSSGIIEAPS